MLQVNQIAEFPESTIFQEVIDASTGFLAYRYRFKKSEK